MSKIDTKYRISVTIMPTTNNLLEKLANDQQVSKSSLVEKALQKFLEERLESDAKALAAMSLDDLPSEEDWTSIQSQV